MVAAGHSQFPIPGNAVVADAVTFGGDSGGSPSSQRFTVQFGSEVQCSFAIRIETAAGPNQGNTFDGTLTIAVEEDGVIENGTLELAGGLSYPLTGQASGRSLRLLVPVDPDRYVVFTAAATHQVDVCLGDISGQFGGPDLRDLGGWTGTLITSG